MALIDRYWFCKVLFIVHVLSRDAQRIFPALPKDSLPYCTCA